MKIFKAMIVASNPCYIKTILVIAENKNLAHEQVCKEEGRQVSYKKDLEEINIDLNQPNVIQLGFGESDSDFGHDD